LINYQLRIENGQKELADIGAICALNTRLFMLLFVAKQDYHMDSISTCHQDEQTAFQQ
jgi:hypothetical protein